jgi:calcium-dependent protein kinase
MKFIKRLLTYDSKQRITAEEALNDIWILKYESYKIDYSYILNTIANLKEFKNTLLTQKAILSYIATHVMIKERQEKVREIFSMLDTNNDGSISKDELVIGLKMLNNGNEKLAKEDSEVVMSNIDINRNGTIDYNGIMYLLY